MKKTGKSQTHVRRAFMAAVLAVSMAAPICAYAGEGITVSAYPLIMSQLRSAAEETGSADVTIMSEPVGGGYVDSGPGAGGSSAGSSTGSSSGSSSAQAGGSASVGSAETSIQLDGLFVKPSYWRGDVYCADSCISDGNGGWIYTYTTDYNPTQGGLYRVIREDGDWYVCYNFGNDIWLRKSQCSPVTTYDIGASVSETRKTILRTALAQLGKSYQYGASGPDTFDCSGFVNYCYSAAGVSVPRTSGEIGAMANISASELQPGDIVWRSGHVGIYVGNNTVIHSEQTGTGVIMNNSPSDFSAFVRVVD